MKIRSGFVSNSSSSSFSILKRDLTKKQVKKIINHKKKCKKFAMYCSDDEEWSVTDHGDIIIGSTYMDNFDMMKFFKYIDIDDSVIEWGA